MLAFKVTLTSIEVTSQNAPLDFVRINHHGPTVQHEGNTEECFRSNAVCCSLCGKSLGESGGWQQGALLHQVSASYSCPYILLPKTECLENHSDCFIHCNSNWAFSPLKCKLGCHKNIALCENK